MNNKRDGIAAILMVGLGSLFGIWALAALVGGLHRVDWRVTELGRQWLIASGLLAPLHTMVDFYSHIKGIEYLICVFFFVGFPVFYGYLERKNRPKVETREKAR